MKLEVLKLQKRERRTQWKAASHVPLLLKHSVVQRLLERRTGLKVLMTLTITKPSPTNSCSHQCFARHLSGVIDRGSFDCG